MAARIGIYTLRIMGPNPELDETGEEFARRYQAVMDEISPVISQAEQEISEQLPEGYYAKIEDA